MKFIKFFVGITLALLITAKAEAINEYQAVSEIPQTAGQPLTTLTSENSGLNPNYSVPLIQGSRPIPPGDVLPNVTATSAIVIEASTGHVIYSRNADQRMFPASTTKMMTLIMALESGRLDEIVTVGPNADGAEGSTLWLNSGERIPLRELLYGMIMVSGNDASIAIAEHLDGTVYQFAENMTKRANELGAKSTHFTNPHGLPDDNHYTTAHDLAILAAYGYIVTAKEVSYDWIHDFPKILRSENQMLWLYRGGNGIKTGYTDSAGRCLISAAKRDGIQIISVVLDSEYMWNDSILLLDYGFQNVKFEKLVKAGEVVKNIPVMSGRRKSVQVQTTEEIVMPIFGNDEPYQVVYDMPKVLNAPVTNGQKIGKVRVMYGDKEAASTDIIATADIEQKSFFRWLLEKVKSIF